MIKKPLLYLSKMILYKEKTKLMQKKPVFWLICILIVVAATIPATAQIKLPSLVRDSMILQRDHSIKIWGWASKGEKIKVAFNGREFSTRAGDNLKWLITLPAMPAGGPYSMTIKGKNTIKLREILIGDVWLCSGQSNMVHQLSLHSVYYPKAIKDAHYPEIRQFWVPNTPILKGPADSLNGGAWKPATPAFVGDFSAVAYFFAKAIYERYHVPIGIINASVGGTPIEAWISDDGFKGFPAIENQVQDHKAPAFLDSVNNKTSGFKQTAVLDKGLEGSQPWYSTGYTPKGWRQIGIPGYWEDQGVKDLNGVVWYRKTINLPERMAAKEAKVFLGRIVNADELYINGQKVGSTTYEYPQRRYAVPKGLLRAGRNLFVIKVQNFFGKGGFVPDKPYCLIAGADTLDLKGYWQYKVGAVFAPPKHDGPLSAHFSLQNAPTALYNGMVAPLINYGIKGILWYQGESNIGTKNYAALMKSLIEDWRGKWKLGDIPFLFVQLPGFGDFNYLPEQSGWAELREAQLKTCTIRNTGMGVAIDLGEWNDIHPDRKKPVGDRLALIARKIAYHENIVACGPLYKSYEKQGNKIIISFSNAASGLTTSDGEAPQEIAIAGADKQFVWAESKISGDKLEVWSATISDPVYVRYGWADNPVNPNLCNKEGMPASPFNIR